VFSSGQGFYPNYKTNNFMRRYKKKNLDMSKLKEQFRSKLRQVPSSSNIQITAEEVQLSSKRLLRPQSAYVSKPNGKNKKSLKNWVDIPSPVNITQIKQKTPAILIGLPDEEATRSFARSISKQSLLSPNNSAYKFETVELPKPEPPKTAAKAAMRPSTARVRMS
jgi:actin-related protein